MGMRRKCSECGRSGHNSRTCRIRVLGITHHKSMKLFGVELELMSNKMSINTTTTNHHHHHHNHHKATTTNAAPYLSLQPPPRKKGVPWSEEEHKLFLVGLEQLGKGEWRGISRNFVKSRTSTQVASHAQKYFLRHNINNFNHRPPTTLISMEGVRKAAQVQEDNESSITLAMFPKLVAPTVEYNYCTRTKTQQPIMIHECRLFNNPATQNAPSLELSLASPPQPLVSVRKI